MTNSKPRSRVLRGPRQMPHASITFVAAQVRAAAGVIVAITASVSIAAAWITPTSGGSICASTVFTITVAAIEAHDPHRRS